MGVPKGAAQGGLLSGAVGRGEACGNPPAKARKGLAFRREDATAILGCSPNRNCMGQQNPKWEASLGAIVAWVWTWEERADRPPRGNAMNVTTRTQVALAAILSLTSAVGFAQSSGEATYHARCQNCHGAAGLADTVVGRAMKVKPVTDPDVRRFTEAAMLDATRNGMGKMQSFKDKLTDAEIKSSVAYFRTLIK